MIAAIVVGTVTARDEYLLDILSRTRAFSFEVLLGNYTRSCRFCSGGSSGPLRGNVGNSFGVVVQVKRGDLKDGDGRDLSLSP